MKKILIAVPTSKYVETETIETIYNLILPEDCKTTLKIVQGYSVHQARNILADIAIQNNFDYIFWVDSDIILPSMILKGLVEDDKDIICGYYIKKIDNQNICELFGENPQDPNSEITPNVLEQNLPKTTGIYKIKACGFGCTLIKIEVFKKLKEANPEEMLFDYIWKSNKKCSEDVLFCKNAEKIGIETFVDTRFRCGHIGKKIY